MPDDHTTIDEDHPIDERPLQPEFVRKLRRAERGTFIRIEDFAQHFHLDEHGKR